MWSSSRVIQQAARHYLSSSLTSRCFSRAAGLYSARPGRASDSADSSVVAQAVEGTVKFFNERKGFGMITRTDRDESIFVHHRQIASPNPEHSSPSLAQGEQVVFDLIETPTGFEAINVTGPGGASVMGSSFTGFSAILDAAPVLESGIKGEVVRFFHNKGFGFISREDKDAENLFFLTISAKSAGQDRLIFQPGDRVVFDIVDGGHEKGPQAHRIRKVDNSDKKSVQKAPFTDEVPQAQRKRRNHTPSRNTTEKVPYNVEVIQKLDEAVNCFEEAVGKISSAIRMLKTDSGRFKN